MTLALFLSWSILALVVTISPGPDVLLVTGHAAKGGLRGGLLATAGTATGGLWYAALCGFGMLSVLGASTTLFTIVKVGGALYLGYLGVKLLIGTIKTSDSVSKPPSATKMQLQSSPFLQGLLTNVMNPKVALFYLAVLPQFVGNTPSAPLIGVGLILTHYALGCCWLSFVAWGASRASKAVKHSSVMRWLDGLLGALFIGVAGKLALSRS